MIKFALVLHLCTFLNSNPYCFQEQIVPEQFEDYYQCITDGYVKSLSTLVNLGVTEVNEKRLAVKFECKEVIIKGEKI